MSSFNPTVLQEMLEKAQDQNLCPNRIWQACSHIKDWPSKQSTLQEILGGMFPKEALRHEDHSACSIDFCEFSSRNFTAVQQYHEPRTCESSSGQARKNHKRKGACFPLKNLFSDNKLIRAIHSDECTAWALDGFTILKYPRPFMAISHVWSDGTGAGPWPSKQVNDCVYGYFRRLARQFQCEGIWWDTVCVPQDRDARSKALSIMHRNYEDARVTLVHDRFLRNLPFAGPDSACLAIILSSWFTRGWTALELAKSRKVKVVFKDSIQDLDKHILDKAQEGNFAAKAIKDLRRDQLSDVEDLLATLGPRYTSWLKDRATIAGLLAGIEIPYRKQDTFQRDIYQSILWKFGGISYDHLFHNSFTMPYGFSWCATNLFDLPHASTQLRLQINDYGEVSGCWKLLPIRELDLKTCLWGFSQKLIEAKLRYALENEGSRHLLLVKPSGEAHGIEETKKGILVKAFKYPGLEKPQLKFQFVGSLYFSSALGDHTSVTREIRIGDTEGWEDLDQHEDAWHIVEEENGLLLEDPNADVEEMPVLETAEEETEGDGVDETEEGLKDETEEEWPDIHLYAWLGDTGVGELLGDDRQALLRNRDALGRRAIHLAAERGHKAFVEMLLPDEEEDLDSPIHSSGPDNGQTPLHRAAWGGYLEIVKFLLTKGSDVNAVDERGNGALHIAADMGFGDVVKHLCEQAEAQAETRGRHGLTPLHYASLSGHYNVAEMLVTQTPSIEAKDSKIGWTPLHCAAESGQVSVIKLLLDRGAQIDETDDKVGWTPLHFAAMSGHTAAVEELIAEGADVNKEDGNGFTPLMLAAINEHCAVVQTLISHGATAGNSTFDWSLDDVKSPKAVMKWLKANGEKFRNKIGSARWGEIYLAAMDRYTKVIRLVVDKDAHVREKTVGN